MNKPGLCLVGALLLAGTSCNGSERTRAPEAAVTKTVPPEPTAEQQSNQEEAFATGYITFRKLFTWSSHEVLFVPWDRIETGLPNSGSAWNVLPEQWRSKLTEWPDIHYKALTAFHFDNELDGYLVESPSLLNGTNVYLLLVDSNGHLAAGEIVAGFAGDEGFYRMFSGWIKTLNGKRKLDILTRYENCKLQDDLEGIQICAADEYHAKTWDGARFVDLALPDEKELNRETDEDAGNTRLQVMKRWDMDPRANKQAIQSYKQWIESFSNNSHIAEARERLESLKRDGK